ncbi:MULTISPECIES: 5-formyltetrahydrofolate cyclo-ligase [unclassified Arsukibacterium]|uniref:5-formyltetrahydrofolate cyclo-ligase n=1 Tax=unclassified Arsukibacterium TaxID=2635278 RepID=UPI000C422BBD|nr:MULTISPECIES: 5-formyltetrahydrofolate cyclo-ligase [unclassified Arsukibacterium]MAA95253.1 5-formyltetrahydrofolate cyclo-ligase [Rheinheimera sp.]MBM35339.1 5-formyltetrahydrofolate cyclo-ligase [Rheinheimera sp.]|tara:strand:- start:1382 stop:2005 length:624 start_codon:yes stop_codon:yes gene_type:complete
MSLLQQTDLGAVPPSRQAIRQHVRLLRQQLAATTQSQAASQLAEQVLNQPGIMAKQHFAVYLANDAELATGPLIQALWQAGKQVYLPVLHPFCPGYLLFIHYQQTTALQPNRFGIPEPGLNCANVMPIAALDIVFTPLVAFDAKGNRLGMGGGFYDRTLSQLPANSLCQVIGLAHNCQQVANIPTESWDVPLQQLITPAKYFDFRNL